MQVLSPKKGTEVTTVRFSRRQPLPIATPGITGNRNPLDANVKNENLT